MTQTFTAHAVRLHRSIGIAGRRRRMPRQASFTPIIREYTRRLVTIVQATRDAIAPLMAEIPALVSSASQHRQLVTHDVVYFRRYDAGESGRVKALLKRAKESLAVMTQPTQLERIAEEFARRTSEHSKAQLKKQTIAALGVDVLPNDSLIASHMQDFVASNVSLITSIPDKMLGQVEQVVYSGLRSGKTAAMLADDIDAEFATGSKRAAVIARDQIGSFYGQLNAERQQSIGVKRFIWRTVHDDRVRDEHAEREKASDPKQGGEPYSYEDPPDGELPGEPINCRCHAEPVFSDILDAV